MNKYQIKKRLEEANSLVYGRQCELESLNGKPNINMEQLVLDNVRSLVCECLDFLDKEEVVCSDDEEVISEEQIRKSAFAVLNVNKVFLGGTCAESDWRKVVIPNLTVPYFNPVVEDWTPECQQREEDEKLKYCNIHLYVITPEMKGVYSIAEIIDSCHSVDVNTIVCILKEHNGSYFSDSMLKSLEAVENMAKRHNAIVVHNLSDVINACNSFHQEEYDKYIEEDN